MFVEGYDGFDGKGRKIAVTAGIITAGAAAGVIYYLISQRKAKKAAAAKARRAAEKARLEAQMALVQSERDAANAKAASLEAQAATLENQVASLTGQINKAETEGSVSQETAAAVPTEAFKSPGGIPSWIWLAGLGVGVIVLLKR